MPNDIKRSIRKKARHLALPAGPPELSLASFLVVDQRGATVAYAKDGALYVGGSTLTLPGNFAISGAHALTLTITADTNVTLPTSGTLLSTAAVVTGAQGGTGVANTGNTITIGGNVTFSGAFTFTGTITGNTTVTFPTTGTLATLAGTETFTNKTISYSPVSLTNQGADITATNMTSTAGTYLLSYAVECTTADAAAGAVTVTFRWTDGAGATSVANTALVLTAVGRATGTAIVRSASGNITYEAAHTGIYGTAKYAVYASLNKMI